MTMLAQENVAIVAAVEPDESGRFHGVLCIEGETTHDGREIAPGALIWRELPLPLTNAMDVGSDHYGQIVGKITAIKRSGSELLFEGEFDLGSEAGVEAARLVSEQVKRWVSIDLEIVEMEWLESEECLEDPYGPDCKVTMRVLEGRISGAAMCGFPAFPQAVIAPEGSDIPKSTDNGRPEAAVVAHSGPVAPPREWFFVPEPDELTPFTITEGGLVFGHAFGWNTCHTGRQDVCLLSPSSPSNYAYFLTGEILCSDGSRVAVGQLTMGCGHPVKADGTPDLSLSAREATAHYDGGPGAIQFADVRIVDGKHGGWMCGALRPGVNHDQVLAAMAQAPSGDWRPIAGQLELVALAQVPVPGFPVPRAIAASGAFSEVNARAVPRTAVRIRNGQRMALVAAGRVFDDCTDTLTATPDTDVLNRLARLERVVAHYEPTYRESLMNEIRAK